MFTDEDDKARKKRLKTQSAPGHPILSGGKIQSARTDSANPPSSTPTSSKKPGPKLGGAKTPTPAPFTPTPTPKPASKPATPGPSDPTGRQTRTPAPVVAAVERGDKLGAEAMSPMDVALGLTKNKLDLAREGKGRLGESFRKRFEEEGFRFGRGGKPRVSNHLQVVDQAHGAEPGSGEEAAGGIRAR